MATAQRPVIGLKDVVYAVYDETAESYGTITPLVNAMELSFDPGSSASTLFADDGAALTAETTGEMSVSFGVADLDPADIAALLGHSYANGILEENTSDASPYVAMGGKITRAGGHFEYFWIPRVKLSKPSAQTMTKGASIEFQTPSLEGRVVKNEAGVYRTRVRTDDTNAAAGTLNAWFDAVVEENDADLGALSATIAEGTNGNAKKIVATFSKVGGGSFSIIPGTVGASSFIVSKSTGPVAGTYAIGTAGATVTVIFTPTVAFAGSDVVGVSIVGVKDNSNVSVTPVGKVVTIA